MALEQELAYFEVQKPQLLEHHAGQFALIHGEQLLGTYTTFQEAFEAGVRALGTQPFLVKQVTAEDRPVQFPALTVGLISARL